MKILQLISYLLDYPSFEIKDQYEELVTIIEESHLTQPIKQSLIKFINIQSQTQLIDRQVEYEELFERGRSLGLWLFEHIHGEGRARGQAMVDLLEQYKLAGLEIDKKELPDYIPLFLEFLSTQGGEIAMNWLSEVDTILALLLIRLENRNSMYSLLFKALLEIAKSTKDFSHLRNEVAKESPDNTSDALDESWAEEEILFGADTVKTCVQNKTPSVQSQTQTQISAIPISWTDFNRSAVSGG